MRDAKSTRISTLPNKETIGKSLALFEFRLDLIECRIQLLLGIWQDIGGPDHVSGDRVKGSSHHRIQLVIFHQQMVGGFAVVLQRAQMDGLDIRRVHIGELGIPLNGQALASRGVPVSFIQVSCWGASVRYFKKVHAPGGDCFCRRAARDR